MQIWNPTVRFTIRNSRPADFATLWRIDQACFPPGISYTRFELKTYMSRAGAFTLVAEADERFDEQANTSENPPREGEQPSIMGFLVGEYSRRGHGHIITIDVRAAARRQRVGSLLLDSAEERLGLAACKSIALETAVDNLAALSFYKRHGYSVVKTIPRYYANGVDALLLEKKLLLDVSSR